MFYLSEVCGGTEKLEVRVCNNNGVTFIHWDKDGNKVAEFAPKSQLDIEGLKTSTHMAQLVLSTKNTGK